MFAKQKGRDQNVNTENHRCRKRVEEDVSENVHSPLFEEPPRSRSSNRSRKRNIITSYHGRSQSNVEVNKNQLPEIRTSEPRNPHHSKQFQKNQNDRSQNTRNLRLITQNHIYLKSN